MARVLVTGATGFTGKHLARRLVAEGHEVVALVRASSNHDELTKLGIQCVAADLTSASEMQQLVVGFSRVFHVAAAYRTEHQHRDEFWHVNVDGTRNLLEAARQNGVERFIHCSTVGVQGEIARPPAVESDPMAPGDHYQESKAKGELLALEYFEKGLPVSVVRPVGIYGPGDRRFLKLFRGVSSGTFVMIGDGETLYHMTYIDDLIDGFMLASTHEAALGEVFAIAGPRYTTIRELVNSIADILEKPHPRLRVPLAPVYAAAVVCDKLCRTVGVSPPLYPRRLDFFSKDRAFSTEKARRLLGYEPRVDLNEGLRKTADWYKANNLI